MEVSTKYDEYMGVLDEVAAEYVHAEMYNNTYHVHYKYISCDISKTELGQIQEEAYPVIDPVYRYSLGVTLGSPSLVVSENY